MHPKQCTRNCFFRFSIYKGIYLHTSSPLWCRRGAWRLGHHQPSKSSFRLVQEPCWMTGLCSLFLQTIPKSDSLNKKKKEKPLNFWSHRYNHDPKPKYLKARKSEKDPLSQKRQSEQEPRPLWPKPRPKGPAQAPPTSGRRGLNAHARPASHPAPGSPVPEGAALRWRRFLRW